MIREEYLELIDGVINRAPGTEKLPRKAAIVAMFAEAYHPILPPSGSGDNMTSHEIVERLEDICELTTTEVAEVMLFLGFRLHTSDIRGIEWAMREMELPLVR